MGEMRYDDMSQYSGEGQTPTPVPSSRPSGDAAPAARPTGQTFDQRRVLRMALYSGLVLAAVVMLVAGLPPWIVGVFVVADLAAITFVISRLPASTRR